MNYWQKSQTLTIIQNHTSILTKLLMFKTVQQMVRLSQAQEKQNNLKWTLILLVSLFKWIRAAMYVVQMILSVTTMYLICEYSCYEEANRH